MLVSLAQAVNDGKFELGEPTEAVKGLLATLSRSVVWLEPIDAEPATDQMNLLAAIVAPNVMRRIDDAQIAKAKQDIRSYDTALSLFRMDNFKYPTTDQGLAALVTKPGDSSIRNFPDGGYLKGGLRKDPWGNEYRYQSPGSHGEYDLFTLGADNQEGGEGINADIGNWNIE